MNIRESAKTDQESIRQIHRNAFGPSEGDTVSQLAISLLEDKTAQPILSLVAEQDHESVGNIIFSSVDVDGVVDVTAYILAPLAVIKDYQGRGIGTKLINHGLDLLRKRDAAIVLVYGDPAYYTRTGFTLEHDLKAPYALKYPDAWMAQELVDGMLAKTQCSVRCPLSLNSPEYW